MMQGDVLWWNIVAIVPISLLGSLLHFTYDWSRHNRFVAYFSAVNESYWEHIKIAFWPVLVWFIIQFACGGWQLPGFIPAATIALYAVPVTMIVIVFGYKSITHKNVLWIDILSFFVTVAVSLIVFALIATELSASAWTIALSAFFLISLCVAFTRYTIKPPAESDFFIDPTNSRYGLDAHPDN